MLKPLSASCSCGTVKFRLEREPMFVHCCHCFDCQKQTGSAFVINALIESDRLTLLSGTPELTTMPTESGTPHVVHRCPSCKVVLWSTYGGRTAVSFVRVGTLDTPHAIMPDVHIFTRSKVPWVKLPDGVPAFEVYYDMKTLWPTESLARRKAALES
jgi:hypothetical protein